MKAIHYGLIPTPTTGLTHPGVPLDLPMGMQTDGDSFIEWGEQPGENDGTVHIVQYVGENVDVLDRIATGRHELALHCNDDHQRLVDYVVVTDGDDFSERQQVWTLDGSLT